MKPAPATPVSALLLGELLAETELPGAMWSVFPVPNEGMPNLVSDPRLPVVSFTGSAPVGYSIAAAVPNKHVVLELGGNAAAVVMADYASHADLRLCRRTESRRLRTIRQVSHAFRFNACWSTEPLRRHGRSDRCRHRVAEHR